VEHSKVSGEAIPPNPSLLEESGVIQKTKDAGPSSLVSTYVGNPGRHRFARFGDRFIAFVLDTRSCLDCSPW